MDIYDLIKRKRGGGELSGGEWGIVVKGYMSGLVDDGQMGALLMAVYFQGMTDDETAALTDVLVDSGETLTWPDGPYVDKHSTGGVGDTVTLVTVPAVAAAGAKVPKLSGRGLGHTGGTVDKLESIPGFRTDLTVDEFRGAVEEVGCAVAAAVDVAPADHELYALRDVTATVDILPLIVASILSKKLATGAHGLVFDVKYGAGSFSGASEDARELAVGLVEGAKRAERRAAAVLTSMEQPLGRAVGNALEVAEAVECLGGGGSEGLREVASVVGGVMLKVAGLAGDADEGREIIEEKLDDGSAFEKFLAMVGRQGGSADLPAVLPKAAGTHEVPTGTGGYVQKVDAYAVGRSAVLLGAGRRQKDEEIDATVGIEVLKKAGDVVEELEPVFRVHYNLEGRLEQALEVLDGAVEVGPDEPELAEKVLEIVE
ncbi:MAG: thymidine phosphorylase [Candidatus Coatesbacteria bacterium]|nr:MAG: thymidine phosphorylase [Candidatus Coatesbacteria bacterium]